MQQTEIINSHYQNAETECLLLFTEPDAMTTHSNCVLQLPTVTTGITLCYERCLSELLTSLASENTRVVYTFWSSHGVLYYTTGMITKVEPGA